MSQEINNNIVIITLVVAIVVSLGGTVMVLNKLSSISSLQGVTGFAADDTGEAKIKISDNLQIDVDSGNNSIDFGTCTVPTSGSVTINSSMSEADINATDINCTGSNVPSFIKIRNIGNVDANVTIRTNATGSDILTSGNAKIHYKSYNDTNTPGCAGSLESSWSELAATGDQNYNVCDTLAFGSPYPGVKVYLNLTIPFDASTSNVIKTAGLTFYAEGE